MATATGSDSGVEAFAALRLHLDPWRWTDVPFYIRAGKSLPVTVTEVLVELRRPPLDVFQSTPVPLPRADGRSRITLSAVGSGPASDE